MKKLIFLVGLFLWCSALAAQTLKVKDDFRTLNSIEGKVAGTMRLDTAVTGKPCARLHISAADINDYVFEGKIVGPVDYGVGEAIIYMPPGAIDITIKNKQYGSVVCEFPIQLKSGLDYAVTVYVDRDKIRTIVMPVAAFGKNSSFGGMVGLVKKFGGYVKFHSDFKSVTDNLECTDAGTTTDGREIWFSGNTDKSRLAITGGMLYRFVDPLYLYVGSGYGSRKLVCETSEGLWAKNIDASTSGVEAELGLIGRINNIALSCGVQSNSFKYWEATFGIGFMF